MSTGLERPPTHTISMGNTIPGSGMQMTTSMPGNTMQGSNLSSANMPPGTSIAGSSGIPMPGHLMMHG